MRRSADTSAGWRPRGNAAVRHDIRQWRRATARLQVLVNAGTGFEAITQEARALQRQCRRLADDLGRYCGGGPNMRPPAA